MSTLESLKKVLYDCVQVKNEYFSGVGVLVYSSLDELPVIGMRGEFGGLGSYTAAGLLAKVSTSSSRYHDGFHLLSLECEVTHLSQYFSPPIIHSIQLPSTEDFGGRYVAALYGSMVVGVEFSGIISMNLELSIFQKGKCVLSEQLS